jgi:AcrR family transcriptional regulator
MRTLASAAEVSPATPYNLFRTKEALLYSLLLQQLDEVFLLEEKLKSDDPIERVIEATDAVVDYFIGDPIILRPLYQFLLGVNDPEHRPEFIKRSQVFWRVTLDAAVSQRLLEDGFERDALAYGLLEHFIGVLDLWVQQDISDEEFRLHAIQGVLLHMWPIARAKELPRLRERLRKTMVSLMRHR